MVLCQGKKPNGSKCNQHIYKCDTCGSVGCKSNGCSNQLFNINGRCAKCGKTSKTQV